MNPIAVDEIAQKQIRKELLLGVKHVMLKIEGKNVYQSNDVGDPTH